MYVSKHIGLHLRLHVRIWILHRPHTPCCEAKPISKRRKGPTHVHVRLRVYVHLHVLHMYYM